MVPRLSYTDNLPQWLQRSAPLNSFAPLVSAYTRVLILGTMPGQASLDSAEYYAHPRNALWPIVLAHIVETHPSHELGFEKDYKTRCNLLLKSHVGLWDVLAECEREGSLDSKIIRESAVPNTINDLLVEKESIKAIIFNGKTAEKLFRSHITLDKDLPQHSLPSTSPAMASLTLEEKFLAWNEILAQYR